MAEPRLSRRKARELAVQALYQWQMAGDSVSSVELQFVTEHGQSNADMAYFRRLLHGVTAHYEQLDQQLTPVMSRRPNELDQVDKAIVRLGAYELAFEPDVPYRVVINEGIELAKQFAADDSHKFVNGVLDKLAARLRAS